MVKINKSPLPSGAVIKSREDWLEGTAVRNLLNKDCNSKCYICEDKPDKLTVDHVKPRHTHPDLEFDWYNLLLACKHCNEVKGSRYEDIIGVTKIDPEEVISFSIGFDKRVVLESDSKDDAVAETIRLLNAVYNGEGIYKGFEPGCKKLRKKLLDEIIVFEGYIENINELGYEEIYKELIEESIEKSSPFAAFKRRIVREDGELSQKFPIAL